MRGEGETYKKKGVLVAMYISVARIPRIALKSYLKK
jgi:hypothetical protein